MNLTNNEIQKIRSMYSELSDVQIQDPPSKLSKATAMAKDYILTFCENATVPETINVYTSSNDLYTSFEDHKELCSACAINLDDKSVLIFSPSIVETFDEEKLVAMLFHELTHLTSKAETFMELMNEEAFTELCSITLQNKFLHSPDIPYVCEQYRAKTHEITEAIKIAGLDVNNVVVQFLDSRTNRSFIKKNFPEMYRMSLADILAGLF